MWKVFFGGRRRSVIAVIIVVIIATVVGGGGGYVDMIWQSQVISEISGQPRQIGKEVNVVQLNESESIDRCYCGRSFIDGSRSDTIFVMFGRHVIVFGICIL